MASSNYRLWVAVVLVLATATVNVVGVWMMFRLSSNAPLGLAAGITGMLAFIGMLMLAQEPNGPWRITEAAMRTAIASAMIAEYLALVSMAAFSLRAPENISPLSQTLVTNFTTVVGIVIAFYFGASAFVEGRRINAEHRKPVRAEDTKPTP